MAMRDFINKHKDKINKVKDMTNKVLTNPEIMDNSRKILKGTSLESLQRAIESITTGTFVVTEVFVNEIIRGYTPDLSIKFNDGHFVLNTPYPVKPELAYDSCNFTENTRSVSIKMLNLSFIPGFVLNQVLKRFLEFPFLEIGKAEGKAKLFTCHLNKIPKLENNKILNSPYLQYVTIDYLNCEEGKATIKLKVKSEPLWGALLSKLPIKRKFIIGIFIVIISCAAFVLLKNYTEKAAYGYNTDMRNVRWVGFLVRGDVFPDKGIVTERNIEIGLRDDGVVVWRRR